MPSNLIQSYLTTPKNLNNFVQLETRRSNCASAWLSVSSIPTIKAGWKPWTEFTGVPTVRLDKYVLAQSTLSVDSAALL